MKSLHTILLGLGLAALRIVSAHADILCDAEKPCAILLGARHDGQPGLASLINDVTKILSAPEAKWVRSDEKPPASITYRIELFLKRCYKKVLSLKRFLLPPCLSNEKPVEPKITDRFIPWPAERERLMSEYLLQHTGDPSTELRNIATIVTHWTETATVDSTLRVFGPSTLQNRASLVSAGRVNVSCHFLIDRDGTIYQLMPENKAARHVVGMNRNSLCIENIGGEKRPLTQAQLKANADLIRYLVVKYPTIDNMIGHSEHLDFEGTYIFSELDGKYRSNRVAEPGKKFLDGLRAELSDPKLCPAQDASRPGK